MTSTTRTTVSISLSCIALLLFLQLLPGALASPRAPRVPDTPPQQPLRGAPPAPPIAVAGVGARGVPVAQGVPPKKKARLRTEECVEKARAKVFSTDCDDSYAEGYTSCATKVSDTARQNCEYLVEAQKEMCDAYAAQAFSLAFSRCFPSLGREVWMPCRQASSACYDKAKDEYKRCVGKTTASNGEEQYYCANDFNADITSPDACLDQLILCLGPDAEAILTE
ncbi:hypothetical protein MNV49_002233 [Pseudohyphozyma bogoriensis]|nr:hypothetical protein MNV49_002233 [Pseudohyphozyma bogoriensis]